MSYLNINELHTQINEKEIKKLEKYDDILKKCHTRIKYYSQINRTYCFFQIPEFIFGMPLYDISELRIYIMNSLQNNGFTILYVDPNWLFINWEIKKDSKKITQAKPQAKKSSKVYRSVESYKPSGTFVYDDISMMNMKDKTRHININ
jgi:hypothetical protein